MTTFESTIRQINYPQQNVYNKLSDLSNLQALKERYELMKDTMPEEARQQAEKIKDMTFASDSPCRITYRSRGIPIFVYSFAFIHILRARSLFRRSFGRWCASSLNASTVADSRVFRTRGHVDFTIGTPEFRGAVTGGSPQPAW